MKIRYFPDLLIILIVFALRTKNAVRDLDNLNYRKMKKILMVESCENESAAGDSEDTPDVQASGGDSSRSNSINSEHSLHSVGISATSSQVNLQREQVH